jgi:tRNA A-37 threonylcarbamoyl transferase component Bud32/membrane-associated phospholipid phosphatase
VGTVPGRTLESRFVLPSVTRTTRTGRRRRPSGEAPPLPRPINASGRFYLSMTGLVLVLWAVVMAFEPAFVAMTRGDVAVLEAIAELRTDAGTSLMKAVSHLGDEWVVRVLRWGTVLALLAFRRFRHLLVYLFVTLLVAAVVSVAAVAIGRMRPLGVEVLGDWSGYAHPSQPVAALGMSLIGILYTLVPAGRPRNLGKWLAGIPIVLLIAARLYLAVDHPTDVLASLVVGMAVPVVLFRLMTPTEVWPVTYHRHGRSAHLDVGGRRGRAIIAALDQQLGLNVLSVEPFALEGSAGSTPLRIMVAGEEDEEPTKLFGKLYASSHLRADQWYKFGRAIAYGRLEDEGLFTSVRRLVEYEDYLLRLFRDAGLSTPEPLGFVEITPEREYLIVTEFMSGAVELSRAEVDDDVIDDAMAVVRRMWDVGLAHRDIKPANILVRDGSILLIDVAFATVRPTPWRQAVDLANMMLCLALRSSPERVYERALLVFTPEEVAEAFAATRSVTIPSQSRAWLRADGRDLLKRFRQLAPERRPISIQHWSWRRFGLLGGVLLAIGVVISLGLALLGAAGLQ